MSSSASASSSSSSTASSVGSGGVASLTSSVALSIAISASAFCMDFAVAPQAAEAALLPIGRAPRPTRQLGIVDYGGSVKTLHLCPSTPNCISTAEEANDPKHYVPPWTFPKNLSTQEAMEQLKEAINTTNPDKFDHDIVTVNKNYLYAEYTSPTFGFVDDVEFFFPERTTDEEGNYTSPPVVEYRSASRVGDSDFDVNRKRIKALRLELQKKGWRSVGF